jgi:hypothetical protein
MNNDAVVSSSSDIPAFRTGVIDSITDPQGHHFGYIRADDGERFFFHANDCLPNRIGTRHWPVGTPVEFEVAPENRTRRDLQNRKATRIRNLDLALSRMEVVLNHVENSIVAELNRGERGLWGFLLRSNGEHLHFSDGGRGFITEGLETLHVGSLVRHKVRSRNLPDGSVRWYAIDIEIYQESGEPEPTYPPDSIEAHFLNAPELPLEEPPALQSKPGEVKRDAAA